MAHTKRLTRKTVALSSRWAKIGSVAVVQIYRSTL